MLVTVRPAKDVLDQAQGNMIGFRASSVCRFEAVVSSQR